MIDALDLCYSRYHKKCMSADESRRHPETGLFEDCPWVVDLSQDASRKPHAPNIRAMCANSLYFVYESDRTLQPQEHLNVLGWPHGIASGTSLSSSAIRELAGESMSPPCIGVVGAAVCIGLFPDK